MNRLPRLAAVLVAFVLLPAFVLARPRPAATAEPVIVCFGDSLTAGRGAPAGASYPDFLERLLKQEGYHYRVINMGISGDTTKDGVARLPEVLAQHPSIAVVEFGGNDGLRGLPITSTRANLDRIIATLLAAHTRVALAGITLPPNYGAVYIHQMNETYTLAAARYHLRLLPFLYAHVYEIPGAIQADGIHATAKGNRLVARNVFELIRPLLRK